jgi:hypothetical protein
MFTSTQNVVKGGIAVMRAEIAARGFASANAQRPAEGPAVTAGSLQRLAGELLR